MQIITLKCNNCGGNIDIDLDNLHAYCPYCGQKLLIDIDQLGALLIEKERTKRRISQEEQKTRRIQMTYEHESREKDKEWKRDTFLKLLGIAISISLMLLGFYLLGK